MTSIFKNTEIDDTAAINLPRGTTAQRPVSPQTGMMRFNTDIDKPEWYDGNNWITTGEIYGVSATGGDSTNDITVNGESYKVHLFTTTGTGTLNVAQGGEVEYLIVAGGGGGGGRHGGGGGAGGVLYGKTYLDAGSYSITVGAGGTRGSDTVTGPTGDAALPENGGDSHAFGLLAFGGGGGAMYDGSNHRSGFPGGSGGGTTRDRSTPNEGVPGQGHPGGRSLTNNHGATGGGGGAGSPGADAADGTTVLGPGNGGIGVYSDITGTGYFWGGGGGGHGGVVNGGNGGAGGGGGGGGDDNYGTGRPGGAGDTLGINNASSGGSSLSPNGGNAGTNTGGGGGAGGQNAFGGNGGSGIVVVRYRI